MFPSYRNQSIEICGANQLTGFSMMGTLVVERLNIKFHGMPVYDQTYIKAKIRKFDSLIKTNFLGDEIPKENMHYTCIGCITIDSVMKSEKTESEVESDTE